MDDTKRKTKSTFKKNLKDKFEQIKDDPKDDAILGMISDWQEKIVIREFVDKLSENRYIHFCLFL